MHKNIFLELFFIKYFLIIIFAKFESNFVSPALRANTPQRTQIAAILTKSNISKLEDSENFFFALDFKTLARGEVSDVKNFQQIRRERRLI